MKKLTGFFLAAVCLLATPLFLVSSAVAQTTEGGPPPIMTIYREEIKAGHRGAYSESSGAWPAVLRKANYPGNYLALMSVSGPAEAWFLEGSTSFAHYQEKEAQADSSALRAELNALSAADGQHLNASRTMHARYRPDISYGKPLDMAKMRFFTIVTTRIRPGHGPAYVDAMKMVKAAHEKAGMNERYGVYEVFAGAPSGTYLMLIPVESAARVDELTAEHASKMPSAIGDAGRETLRKMATDGTLFSESQIFRVDPRLSYVSAEVIARDPAFWTPKAAAKKGK